MEYRMVNMKQLLLLCIILLASQLLLAQGKAGNIDDWLFEQSSETKQPSYNDSLITNDLIQVNYAKKDARLAMIMSLAIPGAGQYYANKKSFTTYLFPVLELAFIGGSLYYNSEGKKKTDIYEEYANKEVITYTKPDGTSITSTRYRRDYQTAVQNVMIAINPTDIYEQSYFRLDSSNTQHFYEDIGKYGHYTFGWIDWYYRFAVDQTGALVPQFNFENAGTINASWIGNTPLWGTNPQNTKPDNPSASPMRYKYIDLRNDAKDAYASARFFTFAIAFNHIASGLDAVRLTQKVNRLAIAQSAPQFDFYAAIPNGNITPMMGLKWQF